MPIYEFRCPNAHLHESALPMADSDRQVPCPDCGSPARRLIGAVGLLRLGSARSRAIDSAAASAHEPLVTDGVPPGGARGFRRRPDPRWQGLPRP